MAELRYRVLPEAERDGGFHAYMPELPGVHSHGRSREQALEHVEDAAKLYLAEANSARKRSSREARASPRAGV